MEVTHCRARGRAFIGWLAEDVRNGAPALKDSTSPYRTRKVAREYADRALEAITRWRSEPGQA